MVNIWCQYQWITKTFYPKSFPSLQHQQSFPVNTPAKQVSQTASTLWKTRKETETKELNTYPTNTTQISVPSTKIISNPDAKIPVQKHNQQ